MRDLAVLLLHLLATVARLAGPGGARSVVAESVLVKHQLLILNRSRKRSPHLRSADRVVAGLCAVFMRPGRLMRSAIVSVANYQPGRIGRLDGDSARPKSASRQVSVTDEDARGVQSIDTARGTDLP